MKEFRKYSAETVPRNLKLGRKWGKYGTNKFAFETITKKQRSKKLRVKYTGGPLTCRPVPVRSTNLQTRKMDP